MDTCCHMGRHLACGSLGPRTQGFLRVSQMCELAWLLLCKCMYILNNHRLSAFERPPVGGSLELYEAFVLLCVFPHQWSAVHKLLNDYTKVSQVSIFVRDRL